MFVPQARIKLGSRPIWAGGKLKRQQELRRKLKWYEFVRMPCLIPNVVGSIIGFIVICGGCLLCYIGYNPAKFFGNSESFILINSTTSNHTTHATITPIDTEYTPLKSLAYIGPILMGVGFIVLIVAVVLYCEIRDTFAQNIVPKQNVENTKKSVLYDMVIQEFRKSYFRGIEVPINSKRELSTLASEMPTLYKALSISTPALLITPEVQRKWRNVTGLTPKEKRRRRSVENETWLKTSSMPNIRPKSFKRLQRRFSKRFRFNNEKIHGIPHMENKQDNERTIDNVEATKNKSNTCFSNPAFRISPPEPIELDDILTSILVEGAYEAKKSKMTHVVVHIDGAEAADDSRGLFERRHSDISSELSSGKQSLKCDSTVCQSNFNDIPDIYSRDSLPRDMRLSKSSKGRHKSSDHIDISQRGPYKTCIGIFRSESCLHRVRNIISKSDFGDGDDDSLDSLTLNDELLKNFERSSPRY